MTGPQVPRPGAVYLPPFEVLALGFSAFEKSTMESFFRIAAQRPPGWRLTESASDAAVVLLSAATRQEFEACRVHVLPGQRVIIIGSSDFGSGWLNLPRPIRMMVTLTKMAELVAQSNADAVKTVPATLVPVGGPTRTPVADPPPAKEPIANLVQRERAAAQPPSKKEPTPSSGLVLVVDDSDLVLKYMQSRLRQHGYTGQLARSGEEALAMVASYDFKFVFLDVMMSGLDGYQTCRAIKQYKSKDGKAPVVVMLTSRGGTIDKIRGSMAGSDAYLTKPLNEKLLAAVLTKFDPR
jgi:two-component system, cell cycle response regulator